MTERVVTGKARGLKKLGAGRAGGIPRNAGGKLGRRAEAAGGETKRAGRLTRAASEAQSGGAAEQAEPDLQLNQGTAGPASVEPAGLDRTEPTEYRSRSRRAKLHLAAPENEVPDPGAYKVAGALGPAQLRPRHYGVMALFFALVLLPVLSYSTYLWTRSADQYESRLGFGSRAEEAAQTFDFLGVLTGGAQSGSRDMDILYQFVFSQELVARIDKEVDLRTIWSKPKDDLLNAFNPQGTIEDLVDFWQRMVLVDYDTSTGLMNIRVFAFDPLDAQRIAAAVLDHSTELVNHLSKTAQDDTTRYSRQILDETQASLSKARLAVTDYQMRNNIVDPSNVVASQVTVLSSLNQELANTQVELDLLTGTVPASDPRIATLKRKIEVIQNRIAAESEKVGNGQDQGRQGFATLMAEFEKLRVEQEFAQQSYLAALAAHNQAMADARKKTRYLAAYVEPTLGQAPVAPIRLLNVALAALVCFLGWSIVVLTYYALRDRR